MNTIEWSDFERVMLCAGTVLRVEAFPEARKPAWKLWVDFGPHGVRKTSAQVKAIYPFVSEFLLTGFHTEEGIVITTVERAVPNGARMA
jgi:tRNA-binding protein